MTYHLFISYSRRNNTKGQVLALKKQIELPHDPDGQHQKQKPLSIAEFPATSIEPQIRQSYAN